MSEPLTTRAVLFDLYRTLIDIWTNEKDPRVWDQLSGFLAYQGVWLRPREFSARFFDGAAEQQARGDEYAEVDILLVFRDILADAGCAEPGSLARTLTGIFRVLSIVRFQLFPDVLAAMERLSSRFRLGIISDAQRVFFRPELAATGLIRFLEVAVASGEQGFRKPDPRLFDIALRGLKIGPQDAVYVGDSIERDVCGAQAAGIRAVLLDRDGRGPRPDCRPHLIVADLGELCDRLLAGG